MEIPMVMKPWVNILVLGLTVAMCFSAFFFSMRKIKNIDPAILFRG
jgi:ABC-type lipoprotein release transport system permease subunit